MQDAAAAFHVYGISRENVGSPRVIRRSAFGDVALVVFLVAQAFDGVLTYIGVSTFGMSVEGNPVMAWCMTAFGHGPGLAAAKLAAGFFGIALHLSDVHKTVAFLAAFYLVVAVGPWIALLFVWS